MINFKSKKNIPINLEFRLMAIAFILVLVLTYPYAPILFEFFIINHRYSYSIYIIISILFIILYKKKLGVDRINGNVIEIALYGYLTLGLSLSFFITRNATALRDLLLLLFIIFLIKVMPRKDYIVVLRSYIFIISILLLLSWIVILLFWFGLIDRLNWQIDNIYISKDNPFITRALRMDFDWSLLFNYVVFAFNPAVNFQRMTLIFLEPSDLATFTFPLIFMVILDKEIPRRKMLIGILLTSFLFAYSGWGLVVIFSSFILGIFSVVFFKSPYKLFFFICLLFSLIISDYATPFIKFLLALLPNNKLTEFENKVEIGFINYSYLFDNYFGLVNIEELNQISSYGAEVVLYRYGIFGFFAYGIFFLYLIYLSARTATNWRNKFTVKFYGFIAIFGTTLMSLKTPSLLLVMPLLVYYYVNDDLLKSNASK